MKEALLRFEPDYDLKCEVLEQKRFEVEQLKDKIYAIQSG
jgi:hypothetical protein